LQAAFLVCICLLIIIYLCKINNLFDMFFPYGVGKISYTDSGKGTPVVLLHGYLETSEVWNGFAAALSEKFRVISVDLPGHGMSDTYGSTHTMEFIAAVLKELLESLNIKKIFLTGHSLGGYVTLAFLDLYPGLLSGYCLFHSQPFPDPPETIEKRMREIVLVKSGQKEMFFPENIKRMFAGSNLEIFSEALKHFKLIASGLNNDGIIALLNGMMTRPSRLSVMEEGKVPGLWILGRMDNYIPCDAIQKRVKLPSNARVVVLEESGHLGFIEEEHKSLEVLTGFVEKLK
jgi:pimeloyl-ACP methyl ester carboxylesterase